MPKHIGVVAGSAEGAALCYRTICLEAQEVLGEYKKTSESNDDLDRRAGEVSYNEVF